MEKIIIEQRLSFEESARLAKRRGKTLIMAMHYEGKTELWLG